MQYARKLKVEEVRGLWLRVSDGGTTGWVFAGNLAEQQPEENHELSGLAVAASDTTATAAARPLAPAAADYANRRGLAQSRHDVEWLEDNQCHHRRGNPSLRTGAEERRIPMKAFRFFGFTLGVLAVAAALHAGFGDLLSKAGDVVNKVAENKDDVARIAKGVTGISPEEERVIGGSVAVEIVSTYGGLVRDQEIMRRVNLIGRTLAAFSDRPELNWRFGVLNSDTVNAFSAPSGYVFITRGLYALAADDDQLAGVLGHEIAHITQRHALKIVARGEFLTGLSGIAARENSTAASVQAQLQQFDLGIAKIIDTLIKTGFDPKTEYEADRIGRDLATLAGYSRNGLRLVLQQLQQGGLAQSKQVFSTHPPLRERIKRL